MRWRRAAADCAQCGATTSRDDRWCGDCGGLLASVPAEPIAATANAAAGVDTDAPGPGRSRGRRGVVVVVVVAALGLGVLTVRPAPGGRPLLGHLDVATGTTATAPPPTGLRVAWAHAPDAPGTAVVDDPGAHLGPLAPPVVRGGRALVGGLVFDLDAGGTVADLRETWPVWGEQGQDGLAVVLVGGELAVIDLLTGRVPERAPVDVGGPPLEGMYVEGVARAHGEDAALFSMWSPDADSGYGGWAVVDWGGRVVAHGEGSPHGWYGGTPATGDHAVVVGPPAGAQGAEEVRVIELATGRTALQRPMGPFGPGVDIDGDHALVVTELDSRSRLATDWEVQLVDLPSGAVLATATVASNDRPALLGTTAGGQAVIGTHVEKVLRAHVLDGAELDLVLARPIEFGDQPVMFEETLAGSLVGVDGDVLVNTTPGSSVVEAVDLTGRRLWRHDVGTAVSVMEVGDGHVALALDRDGTRRLRLLRTDDGTEVLRTVVPTAMSWSGYPPEPLQAADGLLAVRRGDFGDRRLGAIDWLELRDGRERALDAVARRWRPLAAEPGPRASGDTNPTALTTPDPTTPSSPDDDDGDVIDTVRLRGAELLGVLPDEHGRDRTLVAHVFGDELRLLLDDGTTRTVTLPGGVAGTRVVGVAAGRVVVSQESGDGGGRIVLADLDGTAVDVVDGYHPWRVVGGVVLTVEIEPGPGLGVHDLVAVDVASGEEAWRWSGHGDGWQWSGDARQVVLVRTGRVTAVETVDGSESWSTDIGRLGTGPAVLTAELAVVLTPYGELVALHREDGRVAWRTDLGRAAVSVSAAGDHLLVGTADGLVVHLDASGRELERISLGTDRVTSVAALGDTVVAVVGSHVVGLRADGTGITSRDEVDLP